MRLIGLLFAIGILGCGRCGATPLPPPPQAPPPPPKEHAVETPLTPEEAARTHDRPAELETFVRDAYTCFAEGGPRPATMDVAVTVVVQANGYITNVDARLPSEDETLEACIERIVRSRRFDPPITNPPATIRARVTFRE